jgi:hypothetical protein
MVECPLAILKAPQGPGGKKWKEKVDDSAMITTSP